MFRTLTWKLIWGFIGVTLIGAVLAGLLARWMTVREFNQLVIEQTRRDFIEVVSQYYQQNGSWQGVGEYVRQVHRPTLIRQFPGEEAPPVGTIFVLADQRGRVILPGRDFEPGQRLTPEQLEEGQPIEIDGQEVGMVLTTGQPPPLAPREEQYLARTNQALTYSALGAAGIALLLGIFLARQLTRPLRELTAAARALGEGKFDQQVQINSKDEIGELTRSFNQMSADLSQAVETRRQMTADIAHDLRTPLTVLSGYLEAMRDRVLEATPGRLETMSQELAGLIRLVEDLRTLSLVEAGELALSLQSADPCQILNRAAEAFSHQADLQGITLTVRCPDALPPVSADPERIHQLLSNLLSNALRHTPEGGDVILTAALQGNQLVIKVRDTGEGMAPEVLSRIFDRLYRADASRQESGGESGLGLAIARSIAEAHGGTLTAASAGPGQGSTFQLALPTEG